MNANILFNQGWTDIINCLPLINYNSSLYDKIYLFVRSDSKPIIDFYCRDIKNVEVVYEKKENIDYNLNKVLSNYSQNENLFYGVFDNLNKKNNGVFLSSSHNFFFVQKFYECYNIPYITKVDYFSFLRDFDAEERRYVDFIGEHGEDYCLIHEDTERGLSIIEKTNNKKFINLDKKSDVLFDYIKILQNAKEIILIDSVWAAFIYLIDCKYRLFENVPIKVICLRGYQEMFNKPITLDNWQVM